MPSIRVVIRFRPINNREIKINNARADPMSQEQMEPFAIGDQGYNLDVWTTWPRENRTKYQYTFDHVAWNVDQTHAFEKISLPLVKDYVQGVNATIFAYGQSGSGKSFTMFGQEPELWTQNDKGKRVAIRWKDMTLPPRESQGLIPRTCAYIFGWLKNNSAQIKSYSLDVSFYEIYVNGQLRDLLDDGALLELREFKRGVMLLRRGGMKWFKSKDPKIKQKALITKTKIGNLKETMKQFMLAQKHRTVKPTKLNPASSRGHGIMELYLKISKKNGEDYAAKFNFADLAGSETVKKSQATDDLLVEAKFINKSLSTLGQVINALAKSGNKGPAPPFRNSLLSHCLKESLAGNTQTCVVIAASPHCDNVTETLSSLKFGKRCKAIKTKAKRNVNMSASQMRKLIEKQKKKIARLKRELAAGGVASGPQKPYGPGIVFQTDREVIDDDQAAEMFKQNALAYLTEFSKDVGIDVTNMHPAIHIAGEDTQTVGIYFKKTGDHEMTELLDFRDVVFKHCGRLSESQDSMFTGEYTVEDPLDPGILAHWKAENVEYREKVEELEHEVHEARKELFSAEDRIQHLNEDLEKFQNQQPNVRPSILMKLGDQNFDLLSDDVNQVNAAIESFVAQVEENIPAESQDLASVLARKAMSMIKALQSKTNDLSQERMELEESLKVTREGYDRMLNEKEYYQEKLQTKSVIDLGGDPITGLTIEKTKSTALFWKKLSRKGDQQNFRQLVMDTAAQSDYLNAETAKYFQNTIRGRGMTLDLNLQDDDDDFMSRALHEMTGRDVYRWISTIADGNYEKYADCFSGMSGMDLTSLTERNLFDMGMNPYESVGLLQEIQNLTIEDTDVDMNEDAIRELEEAMSFESTGQDRFTLYLNEFRPSEIGLLQQLQNVDPADIFDQNDYVSFLEVYDSLRHIVNDKALLCKIFSLLDTRQSGLISTTSLAEFLTAIQNYVLEQRVMTDVSPYTNYHTIIRGHNNDNRLDFQGAKQIVAELRGCDIDMIRDSDLAIQYLTDLDETQIRELLESCPDAAWKTLSTFHPFERLIQIIEQGETVESQKADPSTGLMDSAHDGMCDFNTFLHSFEYAGLDEINETILEVAFNTIGIDQTEPFKWMHAFNLLADPLSDCDEIKNIMGDRTTIPSANLDRIVAPHVWLQKREQRMHDLNEEQHRQLMAQSMKAIARENSKQMLLDTFGKVRQDFAEKLVEATDKRNDTREQMAMLQTEMTALQREKSEQESKIAADLAALKEEFERTQNKLSLAEAARKEKSMLFHQKEEELESKQEELANMKMMYEDHVGVSAEERARRLRELEEKTAALSEKDRAIHEERMQRLREIEAKEEALRNAAEEKRLLKEHERDMINKMDDEINRKKEEMERQRKIQQQMVADADHQFALMLQKEMDEERNRAQEARRTQMMRDSQMAHTMRKSRQRPVQGQQMMHSSMQGQQQQMMNPPGNLQQAHRRGVSNANVSRYGTVRKKVEHTVNVGDQIKTKANQKGQIRFDGYVDGLGDVVGLDLFLGRGNCDGSWNGRRYFRCKKKRGLFIPKTEISHVYKTNSLGVQEKVRFQPVSRQDFAPALGGLNEGMSGQGDQGEDDLFMQNAMSGLGGIDLQPNSGRSIHQIVE